jgi:hypothetical protein
MMKSVKCGLNKNKEIHRERIETQKYIKYGVHNVSVTYKSIINVLIPR